jgi:hypothetical protein
MFDLARDGSGDLLSYVDNGLPAELTDASGNTLLMLASCHGHAGADPDLGNPSARESAAFYGKDELAALFDQR